mmetsp:Transcript_27494/g.88782  ORF Transcript_27494/g.88782 Transcript_27494/m.88782 type:complete len:233 (+) Transcript_27494:2597-3295(+)
MIRAQWPAAAPAVPHSQYASLAAHGRSTSSSSSSASGMPCRQRTTMLVSSASVGSGPVGALSAPAGTATAPDEAFGSTRASLADTCERSSIVSPKLDAADSPVGSGSPFSAAESSASALSCLNWRAFSPGVLPFESRRHASAPAASRATIASGWPYRAAICSAVAPRGPMTCTTSGLALMKLRTESTLPSWQASKNFRHRGSVDLLAGLASAPQPLRSLATRASPELPGICT